jgi:hypothetical protein
MFCEKCQADFHGALCRCGWKAPKVRIGRIFWECEREGCTVMICGGSGTVGSRFCKWCQTRGLSHATFDHRGP